MSMKGTAKQTPPTTLPAGTRVTVYGQPGVVLSVEWDGMIAIRLDGETRVDCWSPCQVEVSA